ncbi:Histone deacetylase domain-containing protein [Cynara cardunculus var. scolymus]|uniref:histone deacetylase n=1 Tax=Cynara cardunculus var. scolymus TaxID=59895 RepID=A0A124SGI4_CYNCS|nr:Histone deacetylase domain-containing protein [Cynara cardunculus var. scolymus]
MLSTTLPLHSCDIAGLGFHDIITDLCILNEGMIVLEGCHSDHKASSNAMQISRLANGEAETNIHDPNDPTLEQGFNGRQGNLGSGGIIASTCHDYEGSGDVSGISTDGMTSKKYSRQHEDMTLQDIYSKEGDFDDEDDSDWEPLEKHIPVVKWFCVNCTMVNVDDAIYCHICGEHKESGILRHGFLALPSQEADSILNISSERDGELEGFKAEGSEAYSSFHCLHVAGEECYVFKLEVGSLSGGKPWWLLLCIGFFVLLAHGLQPHINRQQWVLMTECCFTPNCHYPDGRFERIARLENFKRTAGPTIVERKSLPHPERPDRLRAIAASLATAGIFPGRCHPITAREITREELQMVHSDENIESVELTSQCVASYFTPDTYANKDSALAARLAAGLCADLASAIYSGRAKNGFALVRPPGHHAGVKQAMGFCLHNNAAVAASAAQVAGAKKVLIVDWDVHHGNGTQEIFEQNKAVIHAIFDIAFCSLLMLIFDYNEKHGVVLQETMEKTMVLYISLHRHEGGRFYPGTGAANEVGSMGGEGFCVNVPWSRGGVGDNDYIFAFEHIVLPIAYEFAPDITIISAGFDAARGDPLGCCDVTPAGYAQMTKMLSSLSSGKLLVILEGGFVIHIFPCVYQLQSPFNIIISYSSNQERKKRRRFVVPQWWKVGRKKFLHYILSEQLRLNSKGHRKASLWF